MATLTVYDRAGAEVGSIEVDPREISPPVNKQLLHDAVVMYQANQRMGTRRTKSRGEVAGTTQKMYRQKGTGRARAGSVRSGVRVGGGHIHAVRPRDYSYRLPKKALRLATRMALASKIEDGEVVVLDELSLETPRTREVVATLKAVGLEGITTLVALDRYNEVVYRSARNIAGVTIQPVSELNALAVLQPQRMLVTRAALEAIRGQGLPADDAEEEAEASAPQASAVPSSETGPADSGAAEPTAPSEQPAAEEVATDTSSEQPTAAEAGDPEASESDDSASSEEKE